VQAGQEHRLSIRPAIPRTAAVSHRTCTAGTPAARQQLPSK
jgi:hypothetical protein